MSRTQQLAMPPLECYHTNSNVAAQLWDALAVSLANWISDTHPQHVLVCREPGEVLWLFLVMHACQ